MKQLALALPRPRPKRTWGGRRKNAGRKPREPGRRRVPHVTRPRHARANPVHVTIRARREVAFLRMQHVFARVRAGIRAAQRGSFRVVRFSVQGDHVHLLVEANDGAALRSGMQGLTTRLARAINKALRRRGKVWADRHHRRELTKPREVRNALAYVLLNHRKHGVRDVAVIGVDASLDRCSSSVYFDGWTARFTPLVTSLAERTDEALRPVPPPRTWLLRKGWRRHGLVDASEVPGGRARRPTGGVVEARGRASGRDGASRNADAVFVTHRLG